MKNRWGESAAGNAAWCICARRAPFSWRTGPEESSQVTGDAEAAPGSDRLPLSLRACWGKSPSACRSRGQWRKFLAKVKVLMHSKGGGTGKGGHTSELFEKDCARDWSRDRIKRGSVEHSWQHSHESSETEPKAQRRHTGKIRGRVPIVCIKSNFNFPLAEVYFHYC